MLDDMAMHAMRTRTRTRTRTLHDYFRHVRTFAALLRRSPETATAENVRRFQPRQHEHGVRQLVIGATVSALRFLLSVTLDRPDPSRKLLLTPRPRKLPDVLSVEEFARLFEAAPGSKYRAALGVAYGAKLWVSEFAHLSADDIVSKVRGLMHVNPRLNSFEESSKFEDLDGTVDMFTACFVAVGRTIKALIAPRVRRDLAHLHAELYQPVGGANRAPRGVESPSEANARLSSFSAGLPLRMSRAPPKGSGAWKRSRQVPRPGTCRRTVQVNAAINSRRWLCTALILKLS
jgi:hypothetical protein